MWSALFPPTSSLAFGARLAVTIAAGGRFHIQLLGIVSIGAFVFIVSLLVWKVLDLLMGLRVSAEVERMGQDVGELGLEAYPEFVLMPEPNDLD